MLFTDKNNFLILKQQFNKNEQQDAIATSNVLLYLAARLNQPIVHFWTMSDTVILGHMDAKLKSLAKGLEVLKKSGYDYVIRNAGGLGVVSDAGVLNVSFYFPNQVDVSINDAYDATTEFVQKIFAPFGVKISMGEISDSYCPGTYDLSVVGKKISGQAQRRNKNNIAIMLYLSLTGPQNQRGQMMKEFYEQANVPVHPKLHFPEVNPRSMVNLNDVLNQDLSEDDVLALIKQELANSGQDVTEVALEQIIDDQFVDDFEKDLALIQKRMAGLLNEER